MTPETYSPWLTQARAAWDADVDVWLAAVAKQKNLGQLRECTTLKERPWSLVRRITFDNGVTYFKACSAAGHFEPSLLQFLQSQTTQTLPHILAADLARHWMLMTDSGSTLRDSLSMTKQMQILQESLAAYAKLQITSTQWVDQLVEFGLPDRRLGRLPTLLKSLLQSRSIEFGRSREEVKTLRTKALNLLPELENVCTELANGPYANALDHGDFHTRNILLKEDAATIIDWGDACLTHPFCSLLVTFEWLQNEIPQNERKTQLERLRDSYLGPWAAHYPRYELLRDFERALWVAHVGRVLDFDHMFSGADEETLNQWRPMIFERLSRWVNLG